MNMSQQIDIKNRLSFMKRLSKSLNKQNLRVVDVIKSYLFLSYARALKTRINYLA